MTPKRREAEQSSHRLGLFGERSCMGYEGERFPADPMLFSRAPAFDCARSACARARSVPSEDSSIGGTIKPKFELRTQVFKPHDAPFSWGKDQSIVRPDRSGRLDWQDFIGRVTTSLLEDL